MCIARVIHVNDVLSKCNVLVVFLCLFLSHHEHILSLLFLLVVVENLSELHQQKLRSISAAFNSTNFAGNTSQSHRRHRRNIMEKLSRWSHGNWCGAYTGGYENHCGKVNRVCKAPYNTVHDACKRCNPVIDEVDAYCMEHDR